jgi:alkylated DNA nucleotide flippase Atl1
VDSNRRRRQLEDRFEHHRKRNYGPTTIFLVPLAVFRQRRWVVAVAIQPDEQGSFFERVSAVVAQIPPGRVTTYGDIAEHLGHRGAAQTVGWALTEVVGADPSCPRKANRERMLTDKCDFEKSHFAGSYRAVGQS